MGISHLLIFTKTQSLIDQEVSKHIEGDEEGS